MFSVHIYERQYRSHSHTLSYILHKNYLRSASHRNDIRTGFSSLSLFVCIWKTAISERENDKRAMPGSSGLWTRVCVYVRVSREKNSSDTFGVAKIREEKKNGVCAISNACARNGLWFISLSVLSSPNGSLGMSKINVTFYYLCTQTLCPRSPFIFYSFPFSSWSVGRSVACCCSLSLFEEYK